MCIQNWAGMRDGVSFCPRLYLISRNQLMWTTFVNLFGYPRTRIPLSSSINHRFRLSATQDAADITLILFVSTFLPDVRYSRYILQLFSHLIWTKTTSAPNSCSCSLFKSRKKKERDLRKFCEINRITDVRLHVRSPFSLALKRSSSLLFGVFRYSS